MNWVTHLLLNDSYVPKEDPGQEVWKEDQQHHNAVEEDK